MKESLLSYFSVRNMSRIKKEKKPDKVVAQKLGRVSRGRDCLRGHPSMRE